MWLYRSAVPFALLGSAFRSAFGTAFAVTSALPFALHGCALYLPLTQRGLAMLPARLQIYSPADAVES